MHFHTEEISEALELIYSFQKDPLAALRNYYDQKKISVFPLEVSEEEKKTSLFNLKDETKDAISVLINRMDHINKGLIETYCEDLLFEGVELVPKPIKKIGVYVPYRLCSSLITWASAAKQAGVEEITIYLGREMTDGKLCPASIYAAEKFGCKILAGPARFGFLTLSFFTKYSADMICGPAGRRLNLLKQLSGLLSGKSIDFFAGPSEIAVLVQYPENISSALLDIQAQLEHGPESQGYLLLVGEKIQNDFLKQKIALPKRVELCFPKDIEMAIEFLDEISPETIEYWGQEKEFKKLSKKLNHFGVLYCNASSSLGDYMAIGRGCADPTKKSARSQAGLSPLMFLRHQVTIHSQKVHENAKKAALILADYEKNPAHFEAIKKSIIKEFICQQIQY